MNKELFTLNQLHPINLKILTFYSILNSSAKLKRQTYQKRQPPGRDCLDLHLKYYCQYH